MISAGDGPLTLVTGGFGFLGTWLTAGLRRCGHRVLVADNRQIEGSPLSLAGLAPQDGIQPVQIDVTAPGALDDLPEADYVIHAAALLGVDVVRRAPKETLRVNIDGTTAALDYAQRCPRLRRFLLVSTSEVYGVNAKTANEEQCLSVRSDDPRWSYAVSKVTAEALTYARETTAGLPFTVVRPFNVYGPLRTGTYAVGSLAQQILSGQPVTLYGGGAQTRAWCHAEDFANGVIRCLLSEQASGETFNIGDDRNDLSVAALARMLGELSGRDFTLVDIEHSVPDIHERSPDLGKAAQLVGYRPSRDFRQGLTDTLDWYRNPANFRLLLSRPDWTGLAGWGDA